MATLGCLNTGQKQLGSRLVCVSWQPEAGGPRAEVTLGKARESHTSVSFLVKSGSETGRLPKDVPVVKCSAGPCLGIRGVSRRVGWCEVCLLVGLSSWHCGQGVSSCLWAWHLPQSLSKNPG